MAKEDGMTPEISAKIRAHMDKYVDDPVAVAWAYDGGPIPADESELVTAPVRQLISFHLVGTFVRWILVIHFGHGCASRPQRLPLLR